MWLLSNQRPKSQLHLWLYAGTRTAVALLNPPVSFARTESLALALPEQPTAVLLVASTTPRGNPHSRGKFD